MEHREYKSINKSVRKKDSMQLLLGKPVYTDDLVNNHPLVVKILRSPQLWKRLILLLQKKCLEL